MDAHDRDGLPNQNGNHALPVGGGEPESEVYPSPPPVIPPEVEEWLRHAAASGCYMIAVWHRTEDNRLQCDLHRSGGFPVSHLFEAQKNLWCCCEQESTKAAAISQAASGKPTEQGV